MRTDQFMGLTDKARQLIFDLKSQNGCKVLVKTIRSYPGNEKVIQVSEHEEWETEVREERIGSYDGMFPDEEFPLWGYYLRDVLIYQEYEQACPWSSGPMHYLALKDGQGNVIAESLWDESNPDFGM